MEGPEDFFPIFFCGSSSCFSSSFDRFEAFFVPESFFFEGFSFDEEVFVLVLVLEFFLGGFFEEDLRFFFDLAGLGELLLASSSSSFDSSSSFSSSSALSSFCSSSSSSFSSSLSLRSSSSSDDETRSFSDGTKRKKSSKVKVILFFFTYLHVF